MLQNIREQKFSPQVDIFDIYSALFTLPLTFRIIITVINLYYYQKNT